LEKVSGVGAAVITVAEGRKPKEDEVMNPEKERCNSSKAVKL